MSKQMTAIELWIWIRRHQGMDFVAPDKEEIARRQAAAVNTALVEPLGMMFRQIDGSWFNNNGGLFASDTDIARQAEAWSAAHPGQGAEDLRNLRRIVAAGPPPLDPE